MEAFPNAPSDRVPERVPSVTNLEEPMADARLRDVAERAGVSLTTASIVTRRQPGIRLSPETRERVLRAAAEVGYRPRARHEATPLVGLVVDAGLHGVGDGVLARVVQQAWAKGCLLVLLPGDVDTAGQARCVDPGRVAHSLSGVIRVPSEDHGGALAEEHGHAGALDERFVTEIGAALDDILHRDAHDRSVVASVVTVG
jgi:hypothetical protein